MVRREGHVGTTVWREGWQLAGKPFSKYQSTRSIYKQWSIYIPFLEPS